MSLTRTLLFSALCCFHALSAIASPFDDFKSIRSQESGRFIYINEQGLDRSCGIGVVASFLDIYWNQKTSEAQILEDYKSSIMADGTVNLLVLQQILDDKRFNTKGFKLDKAGLLKVVDKFSPLIIHYDRPDPHFVLLIANHGDWFAIADPARGLEILHWSQFEQRWSGLVLLATLSGGSKNESSIEAVKSILKNKLHFFDMRRS